MHRLAAELGFSLPVIPNTVWLRGERRALCLAPDEWLIVGPDDQRDVRRRSLRGGLADAFGSIVDVSANRTALEIRGMSARDLLAHGVPIDLDARWLPLGH